MRVVVALGGNALLRRGEAMAVERQRANVRRAAEALAPVAREHELVISHGNGPQVGLLALQAEAGNDAARVPLDVLGAQTEGMIGYMIEQELGNLLPFERPFATLLTMIEVDPGDPAFRNPTKFIGPIYQKSDADRSSFRIRSNSLGLALSGIESDTPFLNAKKSLILIEAIRSDTPPATAVTMETLPMIRNRLSQAAMNRK